MLSYNVARFFFIIFFFQYNSEDATLYHVSFNQFVFRIK